MAHELLLAGTVTDEDFIELVRTYPIPSDPRTPTFMLLEIQPRFIITQEQRQGLLHFARFQPDFDFTPYTSGRIFHRHGEIRWERLHSLVQVVYTGSAGYRPAMQAVDDVPEELLSTDLGTITDRKYLLFGKRLDADQLQRIGAPTQAGDFAEVRIPRLLRYPPLADNTEAECIQIAVREYLHPATGANMAYRFYDLVRFETSQERKTHESL